MNESVKLSFRGPYEDPSPYVVVYNPQVMPFALYTQVTRFGLAGSRKTKLSGNLKGSRRNLVEVVKSYGYDVEIVEENYTSPN